MTNFCKGVHFRRWFWLKRCSSHSEWPAYTFVFLQILLAKRLIRELILSCCKRLLSCSIAIAELLNQTFFYVLKLPLTVLGCYPTNVRLLTYLNNKPFSRVENIELWWIMGKQKILRWKSTLRSDKIDSWISIG